MFLHIPYKSTKTLGKTAFASELIAWYQVHQRPLPWRDTKDPYKIWLSEIILQQTRVAQGLPYYQRFVTTYPTVQDLAQANEAAILRLWQGLGYYTRARNMYQCALMIVREWGGKFPGTYEMLLKLKGVGKYTAGAIASIAFNEAVPVVDGNVYRVLARVFGVTEDVNSTKGIKIFYELAKSLLVEHHPGTYNQALMEFGALHCTPAQPQCDTCIFKEQCVAFQTGQQRQLPVKRKRVKVRQRFFHYVVIQYGGQLYMKLRTDQDIWKGLYDFYLIENSFPGSLAQLQDPLIALVQQHKLPIVGNSTPYRHVLTHQRLHVYFWCVQASTVFIQEATKLLARAGANSFTFPQIRELPKSILIDNFVKKYFIHTFQKN